MTENREFECPEDARGWAVFESHSSRACPHTGKMIQMIDMPAKFMTDADALYHVLNNAKTDPVCREAIREVYGI